MELNELLHQFARMVAVEVVKLLPAQSPTVQPTLMTVETAAKYMDRSKQSVQRLISDKVLPVVRHGRRVHLHREDIDKWIAANKY